MKETGIALRSTVFPPKLAIRIATEVDDAFSHVWFPEVSEAVDSLDLCALCLGATKRVIAGTGVVRLPELDLTKLAGRASTLAQGSQGRFILGGGTGSLTGRTAVNLLVDLTKRFRAGFDGRTPVPVYFAALGPRMVRAAFQNADGVLLNFCSPSYASGVIPKDIKGSKGFRIACYIKLFFAASNAEARRMLAAEFVKYDDIPQYHSMFGAMGILGALESFRSRRRITDASLPEEVSEVSMCNPVREQVVSLLARFRDAGVDIPVVYPYVEGDDNYKLEVVRKLRDWVK